MNDLRLEYLDPAELHDNESNWRRHPPQQVAALADVIEEVGWAGALLYNERTRRLIDGHCRKKVATGRVPVLIGSWSEEDEKKILATLDPLAAMAEANADALADLLDGIETKSQAVRDMLDGLRQQEGLDAGEDLDTNYEPDESPNKGLREFGARLTPEQFEEVKAALAEIVDSGLADDPNNPDQIGNALYYAVCVRK